ncbi:MAG: ADP-ribosylglycohydrolase family protein [Acidimicrobiales bacterium]
MNAPEQSSTISEGLPSFVALPPAPAFDPIAMQRVIGAFCGSAVGDALGAPFEFLPADSYSARFPEPVLGGTGEMCGGGSFNWRAGEFTDDTQMALALAQSLLACKAFDANDVWTRFLAWRRSAKDCGILTGRVLSQTDWPGAAQDGHAAIGRSAANGALMRVTPIAVAWSGADEQTLMTVARAQAALTHFDPAAGWGAAIGAALIRRAVLGEDPVAALDEVLSLVDVEHRELFAPLLHESWAPNRAEDHSNGSVWICLAQAVWAIRHNDTFEDVILAAINLGGDTDTVAAVAGAIAGARDSVQAIPSRWLTYINGEIETPEGVVFFDNAALQDTARALVGKGPVGVTPQEPNAGPVEVSPGLYAANLGGAATVSTSWGVVSLCRTLGVFQQHTSRREVFLIDQAEPANANASIAVRDAVNAIDAFLFEGRDVVVHCHGGHSRTGLVLKAWAMRTYGFSEREAHVWLADRWDQYQDYQHSFIDLLEAEW